ncbi:glutathione peroxidase [Kordiimonas laminariae]|uniref:glutathione peroxidase n=1 Tax=Kordiimonas laminariae TaxID=2917717 RepID=UPI001FF3E6A5|nr:glutathione peroxidase [Kordiimonas laminariae]MCK0068806.1 glutathione peroxidase [Kordiimonas laminariae]
MFQKFFAVALLFISAGAFAGEKESLHDFTVKSIDYTEMPLSQYKGKAVLLVNTASFCGYTPQYEGLQKLWSDYKDKGLVVLGVPANDFGDQEPGDEGNIKKFCQVNFQVDFPMTKKMVVKGGEKNSELYNWLAAKMGDESRPKWNFHKYLISPEGQPVAYFKSDVTPDSDTLIDAVEKTLSE